MKCTLQLDMKSDELTGGLRSGQVADQKMVLKDPEEQNCRAEGRSSKASFLGSGPMQTCTLRLDASYELTGWFQSGEMDHQKVVSKDPDGGRSSSAEECSSRVSWLGSGPMQTCLSRTLVSSDAPKRMC